MPSEVVIRGMVISRPKMVELPLGREPLTRFDITDGCQVYPVTARGERAREAGRLMAWTAVEVKGTLRTHQWTTADGSRQCTYEVEVERIQTTD